MKCTSPWANRGHDPRTPDLGHLLLTLLLQEHGSLEKRDERRRRERAGEGRIKSHFTKDHNTADGVCKCHC